MSESLKCQPIWIGLELRGRKLRSFVLGNDMMHVRRCLNFRESGMESYGRQAAHFPTQVQGAVETEGGCGKRERERRPGCKEGHKIDEQAGDIM